MAQATTSSRVKSFRANLKYKLVRLGLPNTEDLDEDDIADLVLSVGESRLKILQWLMLQYHPKLADILEPSQSNYNVSWKSDSKLQKILNAASMMCLCRSDDIALIRGEGPVAKQMAFIDRLVDLVSSKAETESNSFSLHATQCNAFIDALSSHDFNAMMTESSLDFFPKDIRAEVDQRNNTTSQPPDLKQLASQYESHSQELDKQSKELQLSQSTYSIQTKDQRNEVSSMSQLLASTILELSQLASGFTHSFESHIGKWCEKEAPQLNTLGPTFKRVDDALQHFIKVLEEVNKIRQLNGELGKSVKDKTVRALVSEHGSHEASDSFEDCLGILEESTHRLEAGFKSMYTPLLAL